MQGSFCHGVIDFVSCPIVEHRTPKGRVLWFNYDCLVSLVCCLFVIDVNIYKPSNNVIVCRESCDNVRMLGHKDVHLTNYLKGSLSLSLEISISIAMFTSTSSLFSDLAI